MKNTLLAACCLLFAFQPSIFAQELTPYRFGPYFELYNGSFEIGASGVYKPLKWARLRMDLGAFVVSSSNNFKWTDAWQNENTWHSRKRGIYAVSYTISPEILLGKTLALDLNIANYFDVKDDGVNARKLFVLAPGISLRHGKVEIRGRYNPHFQAVGLGLGIFIEKKRKK